MEWKWNWKMNDRKTYVVEAREEVHAIWKVIDSKMSEGCRHLRALKESQDKTGKGVTSLTNSHSI